jgi:hypothetical protein
MIKINIGNKIIKSVKFIYSHAQTEINIKTEIINIKKGVLQGGILNLTLLNLYLTDMINELNKITNDVITYADDIVLILTNKKNVDQCLRIIYEWAIMNKMGLNQKKIIYNENI